MSPRTVTMSEAKTHFSRITAAVNASGEPVMVFRNSKPWVEIRPLASDAARTLSALPEETREAMAQAEAMLADDNHERFTTIEALFDDLGL